MTCLLQDASAQVEEQFGAPVAPGHVSRDLLYADDTLIVEVDEGVAQIYMDRIRAFGAAYGLSFNEGKLEVLCVNHDGVIKTMGGEDVKRKDSMVYLGGLLTADGRIGPELGRRLGMAQRVFQELQRVWRHANITRERKKQIYTSCVLSQLMYCLHTAWLNEAERKKLDGFHCRCLRRICGIAPAFVSRVSNHRVLEQASETPLRIALLRHQLILYARVARMHDSSPIRTAMLEASSVRPIGTLGKHRRGRPRHQWNTEVFRHALAAARSTRQDMHRLENLVCDRAAWGKVVSTYTRKLNETPVVENPYQ